MRGTSAREEMVWVAVLVCGVLAIYLPGIGNALLFDDQILANGYIEEHYGGVPSFLQRALSYGSFVWTESLLGEGWWKQRLINLILHCCVALGVLAVLNRMMSHIQWPDELRDREHFEGSRIAALRVAVLLFAFNPVAVYAVAYLIQRSIVMAALFVVTGLYAFIRGSEERRLSRRRLLWFALAGLAYALAVLSKEHAVMAPLFAVPVYVFIRRPRPRAVLILLASAGALLLAAAVLLFHIYGDILGKPFDKLSQAYVAQLRAAAPVSDLELWLLSVGNQLKLFFVYGFLWLVPVTGWMSVDLRPHFPLSFMDWRVIAGMVGYLCLTVWSVILVIRSSSPLAFAALCVLFPVLLFATEFVTVWIQDPMVLYRSYLWALMLPGIVALLVIDLKPRTIYLAGAAVCLLFGGLAFERVDSLKTNLSAWSDAVDAIDEEAPFNAFGRWRPYSNRGGEYLFQDPPRLQEAMKDFVIAERLGEPEGTAVYNQGVIWQQVGRHDQAIAFFQKARSMGFRVDGFNFHFAESLNQMGRYREAGHYYSLALKEEQEGAVRLHTLAKRGEVYVRMREFALATADFEEVLKSQPDDERSLNGLGMALLGKRHVRRAIEVFDRLIAIKAGPNAYYGRGIAFQLEGRRAESVRDLAEAVRLAPGNPGYRQAYERARAAPAIPAR